MNTLLLHCRPGFEGEVCAEIGAWAARWGISGYAKGRQGAAFAEYICPDAASAQALAQNLVFNQLIFVRQWAVGEWISLPEQNRVGTLLNYLSHHVLTYNSVWLEIFDTNEGKALSTFCRKFEPPLLKAMTQASLLNTQSSRRLLLTFRSGQEVFVGHASSINSALWPMGIPRLKFPRQAPSRSTLKLEEAWHQFIPKSEWETRLAMGMSAVDLGASPGGWTWQWVNRHVRVTAVDNGSMDADLMDSGLVEHFKADGFSFRPRKPVDWMVCDIVEKPARNAALLAQWITEGLCREAIVNLKLPMK